MAKEEIEKNSESLKEINYATKDLRHEPPIINGFIFYAAG